eukprot:CAMPEP_0118891440 /NCGR_PEP_ID=MMETSP1166-20130328/1457_1 /TAXON_ID=1104430 /ORGANISM="Chrysoreinhardia sp, Strain CCMP3193" /LENGTH=309 /DNA_ID=CAMNT_0006830099 /DNA_START=204 /DNA_END=1131 /DNA_ORIENTATION=+
MYDGDEVFFLPKDFVSEEEEEEEEEEGFCFGVLFVGLWKAGHSGSEELFVALLDEEVFVEFESVDVDVALVVDGGVAADDAGAVGVAFGVGAEEEGDVGLFLAVDDGFVVRLGGRGVADDFRGELAVLFEARLDFVEDLVDGFLGLGADLEGLRREHALHHAPEEGSRRLKDFVHLFDERQADFPDGASSGKPKKRSKKRLFGRARLPRICSFSSWSRFSSFKSSFSFFTRSSSVPTSSAAVAHCFVPVLYAKAVSGVDTKADATSADVRIIKERIFRLSCSFARASFALACFLDDPDVGAGGVGLRVD